MNRGPATLSAQLLAWGAHLYTALGLPLAAGIAACIVRGDAPSFRWAFLFMFLASLIDSTDGALARRVHVKEVLPGFDGTKLDDIIDFLTFTALPLLLLWRAAVLPSGQQWVLLVALVSSAYGFCQVRAKTPDGYFVGFPSYWNIVAFYLMALQFSPWVASGIILVLALLTFVPSYYVYPSRATVLRRPTIVLGIAWATMLSVLFGYLVTHEIASDRFVDSTAWVLALISLFYPIYYMALSWALTLARWRAGSGHGPA